MRLKDGDVTKARLRVLEAQLQVLATCGIKLNRGITAKDVREVGLGFGLSREEVATERPHYLEVLERMGFETYKPPHRMLSDGIWRFDVECIYKTGDYVEIAKRIRALAGGSLPLKRIKDRIDSKSGTAWLEFDLEGRRVRWDLRVHRDWVDGTVFFRFAKLLASRRTAKRFTFYGLGGQDCLIGCATPSQVRRLRRRAGVWFIHLRAGLI